jgi:hypothetical protein
MKPSRPRDANQRAKLIVEIATGQAKDPKVQAKATPAEAGRKGGRTRASKLSAQERSEAARKAVKARWLRDP